MINIKFSNQASTTLVDPILSTDNTIVVEDASVFPMIAADEYFIVCVASSSAGYEIMKVVGVEDNTLTVVRAQEGTSVKDFPSGASVENRLTAGSLNSVIENASETVPHAREDSTSIGQGSEELFGHVKITDSDTSEATSILGIGVSPYAMKVAFDKILGASTETILTTSGNFLVPVTGVYNITCVAGGGRGGSGGTGWMCYGKVDTADGGECFAKQGGAGGGGGAGQTITKSVSLTKGNIVSYVVGGPNGSTTFGTHITTLPGGNGGSGSSPGDKSTCDRATVAYGGVAGTSYGSVATAGANGSYYNRLCGYNPTIGNNYSVGTGGVSSEGTYGNGGTGGYGGGCWGQTGTWGGGPGTPGTQGCIKIRLAVG